MSVSTFDGTQLHADPGRAATWQASAPRSPPSRVRPAPGVCGIRRSRPVRSFRARAGRRAPRRTIPARNAPGMRNASAAPRIIMACTRSHFVAHQRPEGVVADSLVHMMPGHCRNDRDRTAAGRSGPGTASAPRSCRKLISCSGGADIVGIGEVRGGGGVEEMHHQPPERISRTAAIVDQARPVSVARGVDVLPERRQQVMQRRKRQAVSGHGARQFGEQRGMNRRGVAVCDGRHARA